MKRRVWLIYCILFLLVINLKVVLAGNATVTITLKDNNGSYIYDSYGSCPYTAIAWNSVETRIYNESGNETISNYNSGCEEIYYLKSGTYKIKVVERKDFDQADLPLYEKTITVKEGNIYNIGAVDIGNLGKSNS